MVPGGQVWVRATAAMAGVIFVLKQEGGARVETPPRRAALLSP